MHSSGDRRPPKALWGHTSHFGVFQVTESSIDTGQTRPHDSCQSPQRKKLKGLGIPIDNGMCKAPNRGCVHQKRTIDGWRLVVLYAACLNSGQR